MFTRKRIVIALGGNALGNTLPEQMVAVKTTAKALCDLIEEGHQVVVVHGNGPQVGMINNAMSAIQYDEYYFSIYLNSETAFKIKYLFESSWNITAIQLLICA